MDEASCFKAKLLAKLMTWLLYPYIHTGKYKLKPVQKKMDKRMQEEDPYNKAFVGIVGRDRYDNSCAICKADGRKVFGTLSQVF